LKMYRLYRTPAEVMQELAEEPGQIVTSIEARIWKQFQRIGLFLAASLKPYLVAPPGSFQIIAVDIMFDSSLKWLHHRHQRIPSAYDREVQKHICAAHA